MCDDTLKSIEAIRLSSEPIPLEKVRTWMKNSDIEVLGATFHTIIDYPYCEHIEPPMEEADEDKFITYFLERCLRENVEGNWSLTRYEAARDIAHQFKVEFNNEDKDYEDFLIQIKDMLANVYLTGDDKLRKVIVQNILKYILREPRWRAMFEDWRDHPILCHAYREAMEWAEHHRILRSKEWAERNTTLKSIIDTLSSSRPIPLEDVKCWMKSSDIEVLGAAYLVVAHSPYFERINPPAAVADIESFVFNYLEYCLRERMLMVIGNIENWRLAAMVPQAR